MRDPYEILGVSRDASFEEIRRAYRKRAKEVHPDLGGSHEDTVELNTAYAFILNEIKEKEKRREEHEARAQRSSSNSEQSSRAEDTYSRSKSSQQDQNWKNKFKDIDEELEAMRRASEQYESQMRAKQRAAWAAGDRVIWAKLTWDDFFGFFTRTANSGLKGIGLLAAALLGIGSWLLELNLVSAFILAGSLIGFAFSVALKSDKGGLMSAVLVLLGLLTIWVPPTRALFFSNPLATISVLVCLALILKFVSVAGRAGLMTGGVVALYLIATIISQTSQPGGNRGGIVSPNNTTATANPPFSIAQSTTAQSNVAQPNTTQSGGTQSQNSPPAQTQTAAIAPQPKPQAPAPVEPRELTAALGVKLVFNPDVPYQLKIRSGMTTTIHSNDGTVALYRGDHQDGQCQSSITLVAPASSTPYSSAEELIHSCGNRAVFDVVSVN
jgi:hypothetical protein